MSTGETESFIRRIHSSGRRVVLAVTGGGSQAVSQLLSVPGASQSVLEAAVPYADAALVRWLGTRPERACDSPTARAMAMVAYRRALEYDPAEEQVAGIACTASLASDRPKHGPHRIHVAWQSAAETSVVSVELEKGKRSRYDEELLAARLVLNQVAQACALDERLPLDLSPQEPIVAARQTAPPAWRELLAGRLDRLSLLAAERDTHPQAVLAGAFNPLHAGHRGMARVAERLLASPVHYELSIENADKPPLDYLAIEQRRRQFEPDDRLWLSRAPTFVEKARLFPGATFVVGADTVARIANPKYYGGHAAAAQRAIERIAAAGCRFLVFGRLVDGRYPTLAELELPPALAAICQEVPEAIFRDDISSTELRGGVPPAR